MLKSETPTSIQTIEVRATSIEIVAVDANGDQAGFELAPLSDSASKSIAANPFVRAEHPSLELLRSVGIVDAADRELLRMTALSKSLGPSTTFHVRAASLAGAIGRTPEGVQHLLRALEMDPTDSARAHIAIQFISNGGIANAEAALGEASTNEDVEVARAALSFVKGNIANTKEFLGRVLNMSPDRFEARMLSGAINLAEMNPERAVRDFRIALDQRPDANVAHRNLSVALWTVGQRDSAIRHAKIAASLDPADMQSAVVLSEMSFLANRQREALPLLERTARIHPTESRITRRLARTYFLSQEFSNAQRCLAREYGSNPDIELINNLAASAWRAGDLLTARKVFLKGLDQEIAPTEESATFLANAAQFLVEQGDKERAGTVFKQLTRPSGELFAILSKSREAKERVLMQYLALLEMQEEFAEAQALGALALNSWNLGTDVEARVRLFFVYFNCLVLRDREGTLRECEQVLELLQKSRDVSKHARTMAINNVTFAFLYWGMLDRAEALLSRLSSVFHKEPHPTATLGLYCLRRGEIERAVSLYREAISLAPQRPLKDQIRQRMNIEMARSALEHGDHREARRLLEHSKSDAFAFEYAKREATELLKSLGAK